MQQHFHHVFHADKITALVAIGIAIVFAKQFHIAAFIVLVEMVKRHRSHAAFVLLVHAIHIEVTEARHLRAQALCHALAQHLVEQKFRIAIHIQRAFQFALFAEHFAFAIHGGAGSINEWNAFVLAPIKQIQGVLVVVFHHVQTIVVHGV